MAGAAERSCQNVSMQTGLPLEYALTMFYSKLQGLLALKQQQASIVEAKAALERADQGVEQGKSIMAFTIMTIIFVSQTRSERPESMVNRSDARHHWDSSRPFLA